MRVKIEHPIMTVLRGALINIAPGVPIAVTGVARAVIELHEPVAVKIEDGHVTAWVCRGCDPGEYAEGPADAPCTTLIEVADALGVQVPQ